MSTKCSECGAPIKVQAYITDLETKLAKSQQELVELRLVHRQMVNGIRGLGEKLIDDTCG